MKHIWLFCGYDYYACGGLQDLKGRFHSVDGAVSALIALAAETTGESFGWYQIVDVNSGKICRHHGGGGYGTQVGDLGNIEWPEGVEVAPEDSGENILTQ